MPRVPRPWFRFYSETLGDGKIRCRPPAERWCWTALLCIAGEAEERGELTIGSHPATPCEIADLAALPVKTVRSALDYFIEEKMLADQGGVLVVARWKERQFESDESMERTRKYRAKAGGSDDFSPSQRRHCDGRSDGLATPQRTESENRVKSSSEGDNFEQAVEILAQRRLNRSTKTIRNPEGWLAGARAGLMGDHAEAAALAPGGMTPTQLADWLEPPPKPPRAEGARIPETPMPEMQGAPTEAGKAAMEALKASVRATKA